MQAITSAICVQINNEDKEMANNILKNLGLNMSTFVNMAIKQLIYKDGLPFEVKNVSPTKDLEDALEEGKIILQKLKKGERKGYNNMNDFIKSLDD